MLVFLKNDRLVRLWRVYAPYRLSHDMVYPAHRGMEVLNA